MVLRRIIDRIKRKGEDDKKNDRGGCGGDIWIEVERGGDNLGRVLRSREKAVERWPGFGDILRDEEFVRLEFEVGEYRVQMERRE